MGVNGEPPSISPMVPVNVPVAGGLHSSLVFLNRSDAKNNLLQLHNIPISPPKSRPLILH